MKKRLLALVLVLALAVGMVSMTVYAVDTDDESAGGKYVAKVEYSDDTETTGPYAVLEDAIRAAHEYNEEHGHNEGHEAWVVLLRDINASELDCLNKNWDDSIYDESTGDPIKEYPCACGVTIRMNEKTCTGNITLALGNSLSFRNGTISGDITSNCTNLEMMDMIVTGNVVATRGYLGIYMDWDRLAPLEDARNAGTITDEKFNEELSKIVSRIGGQIRLYGMAGDVVKEEYSVGENWYPSTVIDANISGDTVIGGNIMLYGQGENIDLTLCDADLGANTIFDNTDIPEGSSKFTNFPGSDTKATIEINRVSIMGNRGEVAYFKNYLAVHPDEAYCSLTFTNGSGSGFEWEGFGVRVGKGQSIATRMTDDTESALYTRLTIGTGALEEGATQDTVSYYNEGGSSTWYEIPYSAFIEWDEEINDWYLFNVKCIVYPDADDYYYASDAFDEWVVDTAAQDSTIPFYYAQTYTVENHWIDTLNEKNVKIELAGLYKNSTNFKFETTDGEPLILTAEGKLEYVDVADLALGDVNGNGVVDARDAVMVLKYLVGLRTCASDQIERMDVDGSGKVTTIDAVYILRYVAQLIDKFPAAK